jgi:hypothetical protein
VTTQNDEQGPAKKFRCDTCNRAFATRRDKERHKLDKHYPHRKLSSKDRPADLGPITCGYPDCNQSFSHEWNAKQHRRDVHGEPVETSEFSCRPCNLQHDGGG